MRFLASMSSGAALLLLVLIIPSSLAGFRPGLPQLGHEERRTVEKRSYFGSLGSLFSKRDDCGTKYGSTYVDCGYDGCFQPSLGEVCCGAASFYCLAGQYCFGNHCCPDGLDTGCCAYGRGCPANVSSYFTDTFSTPPPPGTTSLPVAASTSVKVSATSTEESTSAVAVVTTPLTTTLAPATVKSTSRIVAGIGTSSGSGVVTTDTASGTSFTHTGGAVSTSAGSGAQEMRMRMGIEGVAVGVLGVVGFVAGLI